MKEKLKVGDRVKITNLLALHGKITTITAIEDPPEYPGRNRYVLEIAPGSLFHGGEFKRCSKLDEVLE